MTNFISVLVIVIFSTGALAKTPQEILADYEKKVIDMHTHSVCWPPLNEPKDCYINPEFEKIKVGGVFSKLDAYFSAFGVTRAELEKESSGVIFRKLSQRVADSKYLNSALVLALDGYYDENGEFDKQRTHVFISNQLTAKWTDEFSNLHFGASVNPNRKDALKELDWAKAHGSKVIKWIPCTMGINPSNKKHIPFYKKLVDLNLPLLSHTSTEDSFLKSQNSLCDPKLLELPLSLGVTVIASHAATKSPRRVTRRGQKHKPSFFENLLDLAGKYPKLYVDNSSLTQVNKYNHLEYTLIEELQGRVLYGSDWPLINAGLLGIPLVSHEYYRIPRDWKRYIRTLTNEFDRDLALKAALGMPLSTVSDTLDFLGF